MPILPNAAKILKCTYSGTYGATKWVNVFHMRYTGTLSLQADADSIASGLSNAWNTNIAPLVITVCSLTQTTLQDLSTPSGLQSVNQSSHSGGVSNSFALPANVAMTVSFKIARRYRGGHPRMYIPAQSGTNTVSQQQWTPSWAASSKTAMVAWLAALNAITTANITLMEVGSLSYYTGHALRPTPLFDPFSTAVVHGRVDSMRRRLGKELP